MGTPRGRIGYHGHTGSSAERGTSTDKFSDIPCLGSMAKERRNHHRKKLTDSSGMIEARW